MLVNLAESINLDLLPKKKFDSSTGGRDFARKQREGSTTQGVRAEHASSGLGFGVVKAK
jgi:hypothetical protein